MDKRGIDQERRRITQADVVAFYRRGAVLFWLGFLGLLVMMVLTLIVSSWVVNVPPGSCNMADFAAFWTMALPAAPWYLILAIVCFVGSFEATVLYKSALRLMAALDIVGLVFMALAPSFLCRFMIIACLMYYVPIFVWLGYCAVRAYKTYTNLMKLTENKK